LQRCIVGRGSHRFIIANTQCSKAINYSPHEVSFDLDQIFFCSMQVTGKRLNWLFFSRCTCASSRRRRKFAQLPVSLRNQLKHRFPGQCTQAIATTHRRPRFASIYGRKHTALKGDIYLPPEVSFDPDQIFFHSKGMIVKLRIKQPMEKICATFIVAAESVEVPLSRGNASRQLQRCIVGRGSHRCVQMRINGTINSRNRFSTRLDSHGVRTGVAINALSRQNPTPITRGAAHWP
jgi:hypothetical protein